MSVCVSVRVCVWDKILMLRYLDCCLTFRICLGEFVSICRCIKPISVIVDKHPPCTLDVECCHFFLVLRTLQKTNLLYNILLIAELLFTTFVSIDWAQNRHLYIFRCFFYRTTTSINLQHFQEKIFLQWTFLSTLVKSCWKQTQIKLLQINIPIWLLIFL